MNTGKLEVYHNASYKDDLSFNVRLTMLTLKIIGSWPRSLDRAWLETIEHVLLNLLGHGLLAFILIPGIVCLTIEISDIYDKMEVAAALSFFVMAVTKYLIFMVREAGIRKCVDLIENDWRNVKHGEDREIMLNNASFNRRLTIICGFFMYGGVVFYYIVLPLTRPKIVEEGGNLTYTRLVYPFPPTIADARRRPVNEICYAMQILSGFVAHNVTVAACGLVALLAMHACGQLQVLMAWLEKLVDGRENDVETLRQRLANVVEQHVRVINFISLTEDVLQEISLIEVVGCTINICFLGYYSMTEWDSKHPLKGFAYVILLTSVTFNIFIFCYIGELLAEETVKVSEKSYMIDWYRMPWQEGLGIALMISMSRSTNKITAGKIIELSISSFGSVIKTSFAYLNILRTLTM
ncbi:hypothetical protein QLX08_007746 [Tetragonisca angustula]|uniref:Odorant receptor n=1 Tax=Tetragonisca angustula TaxID=166442 RepID=A0AAW0ZQ58_9HYME